MQPFDWIQRRWGDYMRPTGYRHRRGRFRHQTREDALSALSIATDKRARKALRRLELKALGAFK